MLVIFLKKLNLITLVTRNDVNKINGDDLSYCKKKKKEKKAEYSMSL